MSEKHRQFLYTSPTGLYSVWRETSTASFSAAVISDPDGGAQELADSINETPASIVTLDVARTIHSNDYIGTAEMATMLCDKRGIKPELAEPSNKVCSIGFCEKEQKWYGWSHRAIYGFGIGDVVKEGDCAASSGWTDEYLVEHPEADKRLSIGFEAKTLEDCRRMAIAFAESVG